jgi:hypothetical protein
VPLRRAAELAEAHLAGLGDAPAGGVGGYDAVQREGEAWLGSTVWRGRAAARVSVSSWATTEADVDRLVAALARASRPG